MKWTLLKTFQRVARRPWLTFFIPFLTVLIVRAALLKEVPPPQPLIQDEFSYLLAGETFASFRVTNPSHPLWQHFETIHELMQPTYMSKYPPMQGLILAFGEVVFGIPWIGVLLSMALFCGLLPWAFRAWVPCHWALIGALLATWRIGILSYWTESYWGGAAAAIGGCLVLGTVRRLSIAPTPGMAAVFALGVGILANSRPYEGLVFVIASFAYVVWKWLNSARWRATWLANLRRFLPEAFAVAIPILVLMGYYNFRVTGSATEFPYQAFEKQYAVWTPFVWQTVPAPEPTYRHDFIRREWIEWDSLHKTYERKHWLWMHIVNFRMVTWFYFGPTFFWGGYLFILALFFGAKNRSILGMLTFFYGGMSVMSDVIPHYTAPAAALIYLAAVSALRTSWRFAPANFSLGKWLSLAAISSFLLVTTVMWTMPQNRFLYYKPNWMAKRERVLSFLENQAGSQLVFVRHGPLHDLNEVWTFNKRDIDASRIVWVDSMSREENQKVLDYFGGKRAVWMLEDNAECTLRPFDKPTGPPSLEIANPPPEPPLKL